MINKLGISVYPAHSNYENDVIYLEKAAKLGYKRVFMCLLSASVDMYDKFVKTIEKAHQLGFEISIDTNSEVFKLFGVSPKDLSKFKKMGIDIIRLDGPFSDYDYVLMTNNPYHIKIEFNGSSHLNLKYLLELGANRNNMCVCANFYPLRYTGLSIEKYEEFNHQFINLGINNAAFISSNAKNTFGPWPVAEGLPTIEDTRDLPIDDQLRLMMMIDGVNDVLIGNAYASDEELSLLSNLNSDSIDFKLNSIDNISEDELHILNDTLLIRRPDCGDYMIRSSLGRLNKNILIKAKPDSKEYFDIGDVLIVNHNCPHYEKELQIVLKPFKNDGSRNIIGHLNDFEMILVNKLKDNQKFNFRRI